MFDHLELDRLTDDLNRRMGQHRPRTGRKARAVVIDIETGPSLEGRILWALARKAEAVADTRTRRAWEARRDKQRKAEINFRRNLEESWNKF